MFSFGFPWFRAPPELILRPCGSVDTVFVRAFLKPFKYTQTQMLVEPVLVVFETHALGFFEVIASK